MTKKGFTIKQQDDYFGVVDNNTDDKTCVVNGIRTEIEAEWLCDLMNKLNDENEQLKFDMTDCAKRYRRLFNKHIGLLKENKELKAFIIELADHQGNIYHNNGRVYNIQEVILNE